MQQNVINDGQFCGNVLIAGKKGCGKNLFYAKISCK